MLAQFQSLYPNGSIITELVQIFQGKYIVRCSVQIENVTRATGMAGAETIEAAEDKARTRALMVLGISNSPQRSPELVTSEPSPVHLAPPINPPDKKWPDTYQTKDSLFIDEDFGSSQWTSPDAREISLPSPKKHNLNTESVTTNSHKFDTGDIESQDFHPDIPVNQNRNPGFDTPSENQPEHQLLSGNFASNVTPFTPRNYTSPTDNFSHQTGPGQENNRSEPVDLSDVIAKTDVELQRLGWTAEQGREHLIKTYGKRGRILLTEEELYGFLKHLESQPDPVAGF
ncbi:hypothetical protein VB620_06465 [Nodularia harveyana UHCC-0300]|uniref:DRBM domain-containing protein n=1 Tax=Nodularia harveyana UHCC-0300 TaxID=2974287 RepID=A0ABU5UCC4_9CYAN|nr:hypothetical protein [Nodularia harveyana]MEA5580983.1 hypothetical protein [Nodularia harveyana UHCC-0300]